MTTLPHRDFGVAGERVSVLGLGGAFLDGASREAGIAAVQRALELGVDYVDTSPMYCRGESQAILGEALRTAGHDGSYLLATKLGYLPSPAEHRSVDALRRQLRDNLAKLGRESVDVLQVHEADLARWWSDDPSLTWRIPLDREFDFADAPVMRVLREAKERGLCRYIGITGNGAAEMTRLIDRLEVDTVLPALSYDLIWRAASRTALPAAQRRGVTAIIGGVLQCGRLASVHREWLDEPPKWMTPELRDRFARLYALVEETGITLPELALRFLLADERPATILVGASRPAEVDELVAAVEAGPLPDELHARVAALGVE